MGSRLWGFDLRYIHFREWARVELVKCGNGTLCKGDM